MPWEVDALRAIRVSALALLVAVTLALLAGCLGKATGFEAPATVQCNELLDNAELPLRVVSYNLHAARSFSLEEIADTLEALKPRVAIDASVCLVPRPVRVLCVHADVWPWASEPQAKLLSERVKSSLRRGVLVAGDLNALPDWEDPLAFVNAGFIDVLGRLTEGPTFQGDPWARRIDYVLVDDPLDAATRKAHIIESRASDHRPVLVELYLAMLAEMLPVDDTRLAIADEGG